MKCYLKAPYVRILWGKSQPAEQEPFHLHQWKSILLISQGSTYEIKNSEGLIEKDLWPIGVYELPKETLPSSYTNIGDTEFEALRFEVKD